MFEKEKHHFMGCDDEDNKFSPIGKHILKHHTAKKMFNKRMLSLIVLWSISKERTYGYALIKKLNEGWDNPVNDEELESIMGKSKESFGSNRIYPILTTLEKMNFIQGTEELDGKRKIKYYEITNKGTLFLEKSNKIIKAKTPPIFIEFFKEIFFQDE